MHTPAYLKTSFLSKHDLILSKNYFMKNILSIVIIFLSVYVEAQSPMSYSATPDSANQTPRTGSTGTFNISYSGGIYTNSSYYSICCTNSKSSALNLYRFNANIPLNALITGITVSYSVTGGNGGPNYKIDSLCLTSNFLAISSYKRDSVNGSGGTYTHGGASDLWAAALTPSLVNSPHFGFRVHLDTYGINTTIIGAFKMTIHYSLPTNIKNTEALTKVKVWYSNNELIVKTESKEESAKIMIYNLTGKKILESRIEATDYRIDLDFLTRGIYLYNYTSSSQSVIGKFVAE